MGGLRLGAVGGIRFGPVGGIRLRTVGGIRLGPVGSRGWSGYRRVKQKIDIINILSIIMI